MNIDVNYFSNYVVSFFKENIASSLTVQQKKIACVVIIALGFLAALYMVKQCMKASPSDGC
jgi:hypothetical protein